MILSEPLETENLWLRSLTAIDITPRYLSWLCDSEVNKHLELRFSIPTEVGDLESFIASVNDSADNLILGMFIKSSGNHIGNIKLGPILRQHGRAEIGFLIGEKAYWGHGYAAEAIIAISQYGLTELGLAKITAGCYETNVGSSKALLKAGFSHEATLPNHAVSDGRRVSSLLYGLHI